MKTRNYVDLTDQKYQGKFGHDCIDELKEPGFYILPFTGKGPNQVKSRKVEVFEIVVSPIASGQYIRTGKTTWYHYNGVNQCFKPSSIYNVKYVKERLNGK